MYRSYVCTVGRIARQLRDPSPAVPEVQTRGKEGLLVISDADAEDPALTSRHKAAMRFTIAPLPAPYRGISANLHILLSFRRNKALAEAYCHLEKYVTPPLSAPALSTRHRSKFVLLDAYCFDARLSSPAP